MSITDDGWLDHGATGLQGEAESEAEGEPEPAAAAEAEADADLAQDLDRSLGAGGGADVASEVAYSDDFEAPSDSEDAAARAGRRREGEQSREGGQGRGGDPYPWVREDRKATNC